MKLFALVVVLAACKTPEPPPRNEFEAFERKFVAEGKLLAEAMRREGRDIKDTDLPKRYRAVFIGPSGVFIDRKLVATLSELESKRAELVKAIADNATLTNTGLTLPLATFDLDAQPAATAIAALRLFAGRETTFTVRREDPELPMRASQLLCMNVMIRDQPSTDKDEPQLSVLLDPGRIWIGLSRVLEFQELPDYSERRDFEKLDMTLREHKSAFFKDRTDIEIGGTAGTSSDVLAVVDLACKQGFYDLAVLPRDQLSAVPEL